MSAGDHSTTFASEGNSAVLGSDRLVLRRSLSVRLGGVLLVAAFSALFAWIMTIDCARVTQDLECEVLQWSWPVLFPVLGVYGVVALAGLFDPRPYLQLDARGIRFRWAGFIPWTEVKSAARPRRSRGADYWVELELKDQRRFLAERRRHGPVFRRILFAVLGNPLGRRLFRDFRDFSLFGTGLRSEELAEWINRRIRALETS